MGDPGNRFPQAILLLPLLAIPIAVAFWFYTGSRSLSDAQPPTGMPQKAEAEPGPASALIDINFDGQPFACPEQSPPSFWFRNETSGKEAGEASVDMREGRYRVHGLAPGNYGVQVTCNANTANGVNSPGDYYSWTGFEITTGKITHVAVHLAKVMRLLKPEDTNYVLEGWAEVGGERTATVSTRGRFSWESLGPQTDYIYSFELIQSPYKHLSNIADGKTRETILDLQLPPSRENEFYLMNLRAERNGRRVGILMTWGPNFLAWDYRFRVK